MNLLVKIRSWLGQLEMPFLGAALATSFTHLSSCSFVDDRCTLIDWLDICFVLGFQTMLLGLGLSEFLDNIGGTTPFRIVSEFDLSLLSSYSIRLSSPFVDLSISFSIDLFVSPLIKFSPKRSYQPKYKKSADYRFFLVNRLPYRLYFL